MSNISDAKKYLQQSVFQQLAKELARRYYLKGEFGTSVGLQLFKKSDTEPLRQFLGMTEWDWSTKKRISVASVAQALEESSLDWSLVDFVVYLTKQPLQLKTDVEAEAQMQYDDFIIQLDRIDPLFAERLTQKQLTQWLQEQQGAMDEFTRVSKALSDLPSEFTHLPFFAYQQTGDAHTFDETRPAGRLFLQMLSAMSTEVVMDQKLTTVEEKNRVLNEFKLLKDDIHNFVAVRGLIAEKNQQVSQMWFHAWREKVSWNVPLKEILRMDKIYSGNGKIVFVVENSAVYSVLVELIPEVTIICSSGQFTYAVWQLLRKLIASDTVLYYSGDLDPEGLLMAQKLIEMFPNKVQTIGMSLESYQIAQQLEPLLPNQLKQLSKIKNETLQLIAEQMKKSHKKAYQEGYIDLILAEINEKLANQLDS